MHTVKKQNIVPSRYIYVRLFKCNGIFQLSTNSFHNYLNNCTQMYLLGTNFCFYSVQRAHEICTKALESRSPLNHSTSAAYEFHLKVEKYWIIYITHITVSKRCDVRWVHSICVTILQHTIVITHPSDVQSCVCIQSRWMS